MGRQPALFCAFDIDGTLVRLEPAEELIFGRACAEVLGRPVPRLSWSEFPVVTDHGIVHTLWQRVAGRPARPDEVAAVRDLHCVGLDALVAEQPDAFAAIAGAGELLQHLGGAVGLATGNSAPAARRKLAAAGLAELCHDLPLASAEDGPERERIVSMCAQRLAVPEGARLVSIGDGTWDVTTARVLGLPFVGVAATDAREARLREVGATTVLRDFRSLKETLWALRGAEVVG